MSVEKLVSDSEIIPKNMAELGLENSIFINC